MPTNKKRKPVKKVNAIKKASIKKSVIAGPGMSNAGKYTRVKKSDFAGPKGTYPINTLTRAKSALKLAHNAANPAAIKRKVYAKYPQLKQRNA
jgi:hypothetical protein